MSVLRTIEQKIEALVEGVFGRAFRTNVQPVELARKLVKEMDDNRTTSVSRVYVPNEYTIYLSPDDRQQFASYEESLKLELQEYLAEHARREGYVMLSPPVVLIETESDLDLGEFGIATRVVQRGREVSVSGEQARPTPPGATMIYRSAAEDPEPSPRPSGPAATIVFDGTRQAIDRPRLVIGRAQDCDIRLSDPNVSRRHAEIRQEGAGYLVADLGSTNGVEVNGKRVQQTMLEHGDRVKLGSTTIAFERPPATS